MDNTAHTGRLVVGTHNDHKKAGIPGNYRDPGL